MTAAAEPHALTRRRVSPLAKTWAFVRHHAITALRSPT